MGPKFSLQSVLDYRHGRVEALEMEHTKLKEAYQQGLAMKEEAQTLLAQTYANLQKEQNGEMDLFTIQHLRQDALAIKERLDQINQALAVLVQKIEEKRLEVVAARQAEETLSTLKEKELTQWKYEISLQEGRQQDNVYIAQAFRRSNGGNNV